MFESRRLLIGLLTMMLFAVPVVGCGDDEESSSSPSGSSSGGGESGGVAEAKTFVDQLQSPGGSGEFPKPPESIDPGTGKAMVINTGDLCPTCKVNAERTVKIFQDAGWEAEPHKDGKFQPGVIGGFIQQAISDKIDGIVVISHNMDQNKKDLQAARDAGVAVACVNCDTSDEIDAMGVEDASIDFEAEGEAMGWWLIHRTEGKGKIAVMDEPSRDPVIKRTQGVKTIIEGKCPDCSLDIVTVPVVDSAKPGPPQWSSYLSSHPQGKVTDGVGYYDGLTVPMVKTVESTGRTDVKVSNYDADPGPIDLIKSGDTFVGDFAIPYWYQDYAAVDQVFRSHLEKEAWESDKMPFRLITDDNVDTFEGDFVPEGDWQGEWMKLWGKGT